MRPRVRALSHFVFATWATACGTEASDGPTSFFSNTVEPLLADRCASRCHEPGVDEAEFLDLRTGHAHTSLVLVGSKQVPSMPRVTPGNLDKSYMWHKLKGTYMGVGGDGEPMPYASALKPQELVAIEKWINDGAHK